MVSFRSINTDLRFCDKHYYILFLSQVNMDSNIVPLGERQIDFEANWLADYEKLGNQPLKFYKKFEKLVKDGKASAAADQPPIPHDDFTLTGDQQLVMDYIRSRVVDGNIATPFQLLLVGFAGKYTLSSELFYTHTYYQVQEHFTVRI